MSWGGVPSETSEEQRHVVRNRKKTRSDGQHVGGTPDRSRIINTLIDRWFTDNNSVSWVHEWIRLTNHENVTL